MYLEHDREYDELTRALLAYIAKHGWRDTLHVVIAALDFQEGLAKAKPEVRAKVSAWLRQEA